MGYSKEREEFVYRMAGWGFTLDAIRTILHGAGIVQRAAEVECSVNLPDAERARLDARVLAAKRRIVSTWKAKILSGLVTFSGDPRGSCVKLRTQADDAGDSWGRDGWCVPAQGYRALQIDRMTGARA